MRNIAAAGSTYLSSNSSITMYHVIRLETAGSTEASPTYHYMTDAPMAITFDGNSYSPNRVTSVGALTMGSGLQTHKLNIEVAGEYQNELDRGLVGPASNESYLNKEIVVNRVYLDSVGNTVNMSDTNSGALYYFKGLITNINIKESVKSGSSTVTWSCANHFEDFNTINGRLTDDYVHRGLVVDTGVLVPSQAAKRVAHETDEGFKHANKAVDVISQYTSKETRYKTKSSWLGFKTSTKEYEVDVVNEIDIKFDLSAKYLPTVYGIRQVSGIPVFIDTDKENTNKVYVVYAVAEGEIEGFLDIYIDGIPIICSSSTHSTDTLCIGNQQSGNTLGSVDLSGVGPNDPAAHGSTLNVNTNNTSAKFTFYNGKPNQTADAQLVALSAADRFILQEDTNYWNANCKLLDTAYVVMEYLVNEDATNIPEISFVIQGKKVEVYNTPTTNIADYSLNPVWQMLDYMTSDLYGGSIPITEFDIASFLNVADELDTTDTSYEMGWLKYSRYIGWKDTGAERRQKVQCNTVLEGSVPVLDNIKSILEQFDGTLNLIDGKYHLSMERITTPVADIDIEDIIGNIDTKEQSNKDTWNTIQANIQDPAISWASNKVTFFNNVYKVEDRNVEKKGNVSYKHITNYYTARSRAETALNQSRFSREFTFKTWHKFLHVTPNDIIRLTVPRFGFTNKELIVNKVVANKDGTIGLTVRDYDPSIYSNTGQTDNGSNEGVVVPGVPMPKDIQVDIYEGEEVGIYGVLNWAQAVAPGLSHYMIRWNGESRSVLASTTQVITGRGTAERPYLELRDLIPSTQYTFEIKTVLLTGRASAWRAFTYDAGYIDSNLPQVENFKVINLEPGYSDRFIGSSVKLEWDGIVDPNVTAYQLDIIDGTQDGADDNARTVYGVEEITITTTQPTKLAFEYTLVGNMQDYADNNALAVGVYRDLGFRIRAKNPNGGFSNFWSYIE